MKLEEKSVFCSDSIKLVTMSDIQTKIVEKKVCPSCHTMTIRPISQGGGMSFNQCGNCLRIYVLPSEFCSQTHDRTHGTRHPIRREK